MTNVFAGMSSLSFALLYKHLLLPGSTRLGAPAVKDGIRGILRRKLRVVPAEQSTPEPHPMGAENNMNSPSASCRHWAGLPLVLLPPVLRPPVIS